MPRLRKSGKLPPFVPILLDTLNSKAYQELPPTAARMLPYFLAKVKISPLRPECYTTTFSFTYTEAERYGCARRTFYRVLTALVAHGFIDPVVKGGLRGTGLSMSTFRLSGRWRLYGSKEFKPVRFECVGQLQIKKGIAA